MEIQGYSLKAKKKVTLLDPRIKKNPNGTYIAKGTCPEFGGIVCAIMSAAKGRAALAAGIPSIDIT